MSVEFKEMQQIAVRLSVATAHCAIGVTMFNGYVSRVYEKAVAITLDTNEIVYFPKKALVQRRIENLAAQGDVMFAVQAAWFKSEPAQLRKIERAMHSGMIAA